MPVVPLPSGALAPLERPGLARLLSGGGSVADLARATLAHDEVDAEQLSMEDAFEVALWGLTRFAESDDAVRLVTVCTAFPERPSTRLGIEHPLLAWHLDEACTQRVAELRLQAMEAAQGGREDDDEEPRPGVLTYSVPDTWHGGDDD